MLRSISVVSSRLRYTTWGMLSPRRALQVDPEKIRSIMEWVAPKSVYEVRYFMGLVGYYWRFIRKFLQISYPITSL